MNSGMQIAIREQGGITLPPKVAYVMPPTSAALAHVIRCILTPHPDIAMGGISTDLRDEAHDVLDELAPYLAPATEEVLATFLWPIADAVGFTPDEGVFWRRVKVLRLFTPDIPHIAWTQQACQRLARSRAADKALPGVWTIVEAVFPDIQPLMDRRDALFQIVGTWLN